MHIGDRLGKVKKLIEQPKRKEGPQDPDTDIRYKIADMLKIDFKVVCGLTSRWRYGLMLDTYNECQRWQKNPAALFWKKFKEIKHAKKERINKRRLCDVGEESRSQEQVEGQGILFPDGQSRSTQTVEQKK